MESYNTTKGKETNCPKCSGRGYTMEVVEDMGVFYPIVVECICMKNKRTKQEAEKNGIIPLLQYSFDNYKTWTSWQENIKNLAEENAGLKDWWFIGGQSGAGKTHISAAIANYQRKKGVKTKYIVWTDEINKLKNYEDTSYLETLKRVECLYIDDLFKRVGTNGTNGLTSPDITKTWELLNFRASNKLKTIISTELTLDEILTIDESLAGRIKQKAHKYCLSLKKDKAKNMRMI